MLSRTRVSIAPAYLFACLILGGSAQGIWQNMLLQLLGVGIIAWAAMDESDEPLASSAWQLLLIGIAAVTIVALQMIPLPREIWSQLGSRKDVVEGLSILGRPLPAEPLTLTPADTLDSLLKIIPPLALFCAMVRLRAYRREWLAIALIAGTLAGVMLGALQVASSSAGVSSWYLYEDTNLGKAVGFFANADHMATLLIVSVPFLAATIAAAKRGSTQRYSAVIAVAAGIAIVVVVGLLLNGSLAGYTLTLPVIAASALILLPPASRLRIWVVAVAALLVAGSLFVLERTPIGSSELREHATSAVNSRTEILSTTLHATRDFMPFGSGLGSFGSVYQLYERPEQVTSTYVVHAHNDYVELALELGVAGLMLILFFISWWAVAFWHAWRTREGGPFARAAGVGSAAILAHSLVDFPLRTAAISAVFSMCLSLLADNRSAPLKESAQLRRKRHVEFR